MKVKAIATACVVVSLVVGRASPVMADGDALVGGIVGGIIGGVIVNEANKNRAKNTKTYRSTSSKPAVNTAQRTANREVQTSLNYFGFPVGTPDGSIGPRSRAAIAEYQAVMGYPATGQLTDFERDLLVSSYYRAQSGGAATYQAMANNPMGARGLLLTYRDERFGIQPGIVVAAPVVVPPAAPVLAATPAPVAIAAPAPALPTFMAQATTQVSLASQCNKVSLLTNTNGGYTKVAAMTDPNLALSEQFCLARTYAMAQSEELAAKVAGATAAEIGEQCQAFGPVLAPQVAALSLQSRDEVLRATSEFVLTSGMAPAQLAATSKICLGVGYTTDKLDVAIGSALLLTALGEKGYAELVGHHLSQGFGATQRADLALPWYEFGLEAQAVGAAVFAPGLPDRSALIQKAAYAAAGKLQLDGASGAQVLPAFSLMPEAAPATNP